MDEIIVILLAPFTFNLSPDFKDAPSTRRRVTPLINPGRLSPGGPDSASLVSGLAGQHTTLLTRPVAPISGSGNKSGSLTHNPYPVPPPHFPDIIIEDGCIVLCTECDSSSLGRSSDGYICQKCGHTWSKI